MDEGTEQRSVAVKHDEHSPSFGLPACLRVPVSATGPAAIDEFVGPIINAVIDGGSVQALLVVPRESGVPVNALAPLWDRLPAAFVARQLFPTRQVWVHVDYARYRHAYFSFGMPLIPASHVLDHVQNRKAARERFYSHPFLRLCPISRRTNSSGGHSVGTEGMERQYLKSMLASPEKKAEHRESVARFQIGYADPIDLTKMLDIPPGTKELQGVAQIIKAFYLDWY